MESIDTFIDAWFGFYFAMFWANLIGLEMYDHPKK